MDSQIKYEKENDFSLSNSLFFTTTSLSNTNSFLSDDEIENLYMQSSTPINFLPTEQSTISDKKRIILEKNKLSARESRKRKRQLFDRLVKENQKLRQELISIKKDLLHCLCDNCQSKIFHQSHQKKKLALFSVVIAKK